MKTLLICHEDAPLSFLGLSRWLASYSDLTGVIALREKKQQMYPRVRREMKRVGPLRFLDVMAFRLYYKILISGGDGLWERQKLDELLAQYPEIPADTPVLYAESPNSEEARQFVERQQPDVMLAICKVLLKEEVFSLPSTGTFVLHPGICPEYRNAHGCFWALANDDIKNVGMTLLKIDKGIDTGPVFGYFSYGFDEVSESHSVIQRRVVLENLPALKDRLIEIHQGTAVPIDTSGRKSAVWGQPWLTRYFAWKLRARRRRK